MIRIAAALLLGFAWIFYIFVGIFADLFVGHLCSGCFFCLSSSSDFGRAECCQFPWQSSLSAGSIASSKKSTFEVERVGR